MTKTVCGSFGPVQGDSRKYKRHTTGTYIGLVAYVIQDSPNRMLTFKQIMTKLEMFVSGDRKGLENHIRVCLSSNKCFVKVPIDPDYPNAKRNFWKVDEHSITPKMLRRHFSDMIELFPGLPPAWIRKPAPPPVPSPPICPVKRTCEDRPIKFTGPFSIDSLLRKDDVPQTGIAVDQPAPSASSTNLYSDQLYSRITSADSPTSLGQGNCYIYRSGEETSWGKPVQRIDLSPELHHSLLYSPHLSYDHMLTNIWSSSANTHLTYRKW